MARKERCGAKTRKGTPCQKWALENGRCHLHGGRSKGAAKGNKHAVTTGEYETIYAAALEDDEIGILAMDLAEELEECEEAIKIAKIRKRRMLMRIKKLTGQDFHTVSRSEQRTSGTMGSSQASSEQQKSSLVQIQRIEEALTRITRELRLLLEYRTSLLAQMPPDESEQQQAIVEALGTAASKLDWGAGDA